MIDFHATRHPAQDRNPRAVQPVTTGRGAQTPIQITRTTATGSCADGECDLPGASRMQAQMRTCGPVRKRGAYFNEANAGADRIGERVAVGDGSCVVDALISAKPRTGTTRRIKPEISAGRFANFNGRNAQVDAPATAVPVLCSRHTREIDTRPSTHSHAAHHSRVGLCAVSTGGVSLFNADRRIEDAQRQARLIA